MSWEEPAILSILSGRSACEICQGRLFLCSALNEDQRCAVSTVTASLRHVPALLPCHLTSIRNIAQSAGAPPLYKVPDCAPSGSQSADTRVRPQHGKVSPSRPQRSSEPNRFLR